MQRVPQVLVQRTQGVLAWQVLLQVEQRVLRQVEQREALLERQEQVQQRVLVRQQG